VVAGTREPSTGAVLATVSAPQALLLGAFVHPRVLKTLAMHRGACQGSNAAARRELGGPGIAPSPALRRFRPACTRLQNRPASSKNRMYISANYTGLTACLPACLNAPPPTTKGDDGWGVKSSLSWTKKSSSADRCPVEIRRPVSGSFLFLPSPVAHLRAKRA
jgi:hypothetical protein